MGHPASETMVRRDDGSTMDRWCSEGLLVEGLELIEVLALAQATQQTEAGFDQEARFGAGNGFKLHPGGGGADEKEEALGVQRGEKFAIALHEAQPE
jgi:hypothetical protein